MIAKHADSHLDHALTPAQVDFVLSQAAADGELTVQTVTLPEELGSVSCNLHGPATGSDPVPESEVTYAKRGEREGESRMCKRAPVQTREVTIISGPHDGQGCVLFTAYGGPNAPKEPFDFPAEENRPDFKSLSVVASEAFWKEHALGE